MTSFFLTCEDKATIVCNISNWIHTEIKIAASSVTLTLKLGLLESCFHIKNVCTCLKSTFLTIRGCKLTSECILFCLEHLWHCQNWLFYFIFTFKSHFLRENMKFCGQILSLFFLLLTCVLSGLLTTSWSVNGQFNEFCMILMLAG